MNIENGSGAAPLVIGPAAPEDVGGLVELLNLRPPCYWMRRLAPAELRDFARHAVESAHSVVLMARPRSGDAPAGYVLAVADSARFWVGFALSKPSLARSIAAHRLARTIELSRRTKADADLPAFSWSPLRRGRARILGLYVRKEHHAKGVAMDLYFKLFDSLKEKGCERVEEYAAPDYAEFAGKFPKVCGWDLQPCACGGYKISRTL